MRKQFTAALALCAILTPGAAKSQGLLPGEDTTGTLRKIGDVLHIALPATAGATTIIKRDWEGTIQFSTVLGSSIGTFAGVKQLISKDRPDASNARSFPSGHTAMSFAGSTFMLRRYGNKVGIPLMFTAGFVGFTRVKGQKHFADDVIAGAGVGVLYNLAFSRRFPKRVFLKPVNFQSGGAGMQMQIDVSGSDTPALKSGPAAELARPRYRIQFEYSALFTRSLQGSAPAGLGTDLKLDKDQRVYSPTARFQFEWMFREPHELNVFWAPYEARDFQNPASRNFSFGGVNFMKGEETITRFRYDEIAARYRYRLIDNKRVDLRLGAALSLRETTASILQEEPDLSAEVTDYEVLPLFHTRFQLFFHPKFSFIGQGDGMYTSGRRYSGSTQLALNWRLNREWDFSFGYRGLWRRSNSDHMETRVRFDYYSAGIGYSF